MDSPQLLKIRTLSPVRSPISADSERRAAEALMGHAEAHEGGALPPKIISESRVLEEFEWPWANGYGTLAHDNLPVFFQPFSCYHVKIREGVCQENLPSLLREHAGEVETCCLYLYDDTVALLQVDVVFEATADELSLLLESHGLDRVLSEFAKNVYQDMIYPDFREYASRFGKKNNRPLEPSLSHLRNPNELTVFRDVAFTTSKAPDSYVLWTGRYIVASPDILDSKLGDSLCRWVSYSGPKTALLEDRQIVGSGNILVLNDDPEAVGESWFRGLSICQYYNAILSIYGGILKSSYSKLNEYIDAPRRKNQKLNTLMRDITRSLDHLEFTRLEFNDAVVGVQAERAKVVKVACDAWKLEELIDSALERTNLIRSKITRLLEARKSEQNRSVELILSGIGGVALIDLFISLTTASRDLGEDDIPGLLDAFLWLQPDGSIALSTALLVLISTYIYHVKR